MAEQRLPDLSRTNRRIRVFISSTFRDMIAERDALMTHAWPELRRLCQERQVELVEVDLRWGIAEEQSTRRETLKLCLDEIRACRPFFIGLLGERYGWVPEDDAFTADLREEQPWLTALHGKSVTELEILHGVLNNPEMAGRAFFYFRDPAYAQGRGPDFLSETPAAAEQQTALKAQIRATCAAQGIPLRENYPDPLTLAALVRDQLTAAINEQYPIDEIPDALTREALEHEAFAEIRRRTYIARAEYYAALERHALGDGGPLLLVGASGSGKSALLANWVARWRADHPDDCILQHYIGGTADSADHWRLLTRVMAEIKRWTDDPDPVPTDHDDLLREFPLWLAKARAKAEHDGVRCILVLDALNQLADQDHARLLGWLPEQPFFGPLRLVTSTLPGAALEAARQRGWTELPVQPLTVDERRRMIVDYLARFGKTLDAHQLDRLASAAPAANPLYLKILLDDLRVTGTYERLDERLTEYLAAADIPTLLQQVLARYIRDYERDRPGLVGEALGLIYAARHGLAERELLQLLRPADQAQLPPALWTPLRAALEDALVERGGIFNFAHDFLRLAVERAFVPDLDHCDDWRLQLAEYFEAQEITARTCDELPWLLWHTESFVRLRACLLNIDSFLLIFERDREELRGYWVRLHEERDMGKDYLESFQHWSQEKKRQEVDIVYAANGLGLFLLALALYAESEPPLRRALEGCERVLGPEHPDTLASVYNLAGLLRSTGDYAGAEPLYRRALAACERVLGPEQPATLSSVNNLALLLQSTGDYAGAEPLYRRALEARERVLGPEHPDTLTSVNNLAGLLESKGDYAGAEPLYRRALEAHERVLGPEHPSTLTSVNALAVLLNDTGDYAGAAPLYRRALEAQERVLGPEHPDTLTSVNCQAALLYQTGDFAGAEPLFRRTLEARKRVLGPEHPATLTSMNNLALLLQSTGDYAGAEPLYRRALEARERVLGPEHPDTLTSVNNLAGLLQDTGDYSGAEPLFRRALEARERVLGPEHPNTLTSVNNLAGLLRSTGDYAGAEPLYLRALEGLLKISAQMGRPHPDLPLRVSNYTGCLEKKGRSHQDIRCTLEEMMRPYGMSLGGDGRHEQADVKPSAKLRMVIEKLIRDPSKAQEIVDTLQNEDPSLFIEFVQWYQSQQE